MSALPVMAASSSADLEISVVCTPITLLAFQPACRSASIFRRPSELASCS
ncbi:Uncharacterised protein [Bordetella pertussis]|nr:Uncharacterised protein [Bordetella pertussis]